MAIICTAVIFLLVWLLTMEGSSQSQAQVANSRLENLLEEHSRELRTFCDGQKSGFVHESLFSAERQMQLARTAFDRENWEDAIRHAQLGRESLVTAVEIVNSSRGF